MSGRGRGIGRGRGHGICRGSQSREGNPYVSTNKRKVLCTALGESRFTYNAKGASDQMQTTFKKIVKHTGTIYGQDTRNETHNRKLVSIDKPQHTQAVLDHHKDIVALRENIFMRLQYERTSKEKVFIGTSTTYDDAAIVLAEL